MKKTVFMLIVVQLTTSRFIFAQIDSVLFGIARNQSTQEWSLSKINTISGQVTIISPSPFSSSCALNSIAAIDPYKHLYYAVSFGRLMGIDLVTGLDVVDTPVSTLFPAYFDLMEFNSKDSTLYGIERNSSTQELWLAKINTQSGVVTTISPASFSSTYVLDGLSAIDPYQSIFYLTLPGKITGIDLSSGNVISDTTITTQFPAYFDLLEFNSKDSTLYGVERNSTTQELSLAMVNPSTGVATTISPAPFTSSFSLNSLCAISPYQNQFFLISGGHLFGIDISSGMEVVDTAVTSPFPAYFDMMRFSSVLTMEGQGTSVQETNASNQGLNIFPTPFRQSSTITFSNPEKEKYRLSIYDALGKLQLSIENITGTSVRIDRANLSNGLYFVDLEAAGQLPLKGKMVIE